MLHRLLAPNTSVAVRRGSLMLASSLLPLRFDTAGLESDLTLVRAEEWTAHFNARQYEGEWSGVALRSVGGDTAKLYSDPGAVESYVETSVLSRCPYFRAVLVRFACPLKAVRLLRLRAGSHIREHRDYGLDLESGEARIHIPITTNPDVAFAVNGRR